MRDMTGAYRVLVERERERERETTWKIGVFGRIILKLIYMK